MGTNFYLRQPKCEHCGRAGDTLHIGKSSAGWNFLLRIYPKIDGEPDERLKVFGVDEIVELDDWRPLFERFEIFDDYGSGINAIALLSNITERSHPHGLLSHKTCGRAHGGPYWNADDPTVARGAGTYDLISHEFS